MTILSNLHKNIAATAQPANHTASNERPKAKLWLNVGITLKGAGEDGEDIFVSLPGGGIALDQLEPQEVKGKSPHWINLVQTKNALLDQVQKGATELPVGERQVIPLEVELYHVGQPDQVGSVESNPLLAALAQRLG